MSDKLFKLNVCIVKPNNNNNIDIFFSLICLSLPKSISNMCETCDEAKLKRSSFNTNNTRYPVILKGLMMQTRYLI